MTEIACGLGAGLIAFGLSLLGVFDGIEFWHRIGGLVCISLGIPIYLSGLRGVLS